MHEGFPITAYSASNGLGATTRDVIQALRRGESGLRACPIPVPFETVCGAIADELAPPPPALAAEDSRQTRILCGLLRQLEAPLLAAQRRWGADRIGVALGTSTGGIAETERAFSEFKREGRAPEGYQFSRQLPDALLRIVRALAPFSGPGVVVSTACSSSAKVFGVARRWLSAGLCDAVLVGGVDTLCQITLRGFHSLELVAPQPCRPFARDRNGLNLGEGGALLLLEREGTGSARLLGVGETSDAFHMTAPHPEGLGAIAAMEAAMREAGLSAGDIEHINAHGTGTSLNDAAEGKAIAHVFGDRVPVVSTKGYTGHLLGAAGATEAVFSIASIEHGFLPVSLGSVPADSDLGLQLVQETLERRVKTVLSNSFAFGGNNVCVAFGAAS